MGWLLEIGKMAIYLTFPVATFHYFNKPEYFEKFVIEKKREMYPHEDETYREEVQLLFRSMKDKSQKEHLERLEQIENERKARQQNLQ